MATKNEITGDTIATRATTDAYRDNYDRIFGKKPVAIIEDIEPYNLHPAQKNCSKCGITLTSPIGYVCPSNDCPCFSKPMC